MTDQLSDQIISSKKKLRNKSKDYVLNFKKIEEFIKKEIAEIEILKNSSKSIIPEISYDELDLVDSKTIENIHKRGCLIIRDVFEDNKIVKINEELEEYIEGNGYYEDQKKKAGLDKYFSDLKSGKPQIYGLYWSKAQIEIRHSEEMAKVKKWLNNLWNFKNSEYTVFDPNKELSYADRLRRREPGDDTLGLSPHCDAGSIERWTDSHYQKIYKDIFSDNFEKYMTVLYNLRKHKGLTMDGAKDLISDVSYYGTMMVHLDDADGMVSGAVHTTQHTIRPALQFIKTKPEVKAVSSVFFMCLSDRVLVYGDCAINPNPDSELLAEIAIASSETAESFGIEPRVAMLSYSSGSSGKGEDVEKVKKATEIVKEKRPDLKIEGPIQYDAAVDPEIGQKKIPGSKVAGQATVLIFPDLNTGNNTYKAVQRETGAVAIGPLLQGLNKPVNDLSRGCTVPDIVNTVIMTAIQAQDSQQ